MGSRQWAQRMIPLSRYSRSGRGCSVSDLPEFRFNAICTASNSSSDTKASWTPGRIWSLDIPNARLAAYKEAEGWKHGVLPYRDARNQLPNYLNLRHGISSAHIRVFAGLAYARLDELNLFIMGQSPVNGLKLAGLFNTQYVLSYSDGKSEEASIPGLVELKRFPGNVVLLNNLYSIPRAYAVEFVKKVSSHASVHEKLSALLGIDHGKEILLESNRLEPDSPEQSAPGRSSAPFGTAVILHEQRHYVKIGAELP